MGPVPIATGELVTDYQLVSMELAASSGLLMPPSIKQCDLPSRTLGLPPPHVRGFAFSQTPGLAFAVE